MTWCGGSQWSGGVCWFGRGRLNSQHERVKQWDHDERPCQALLWRRRKDQKGEILLQGRSL